MNLYVFLKYLTFDTPLYLFIVFIIFIVDLSIISIIDLCILIQERIGLPFSSINHNFTMFNHESLNHSNYPISNTPLYLLYPLLELNRSLLELNLLICNYNLLMFSHESFNILNYSNFDITTNRHYQSLLKVQIYLISSLFLIL